MTKFDDHQFFIDRLSAFHDQELKNEEHAIVQEHIDSCAECQQQLTEFEKFDQMIESNSQLSDNDYWEASAKKIEAALEEPVETVITPIESKPMTGLWWKLTAAAASVAIIAFVAMYEKDIIGEYDLFNGEPVPAASPVDSAVPQGLMADSSVIKDGRANEVLSIESVPEKTDINLLSIQTDVVRGDSDLTVRTGAGETKVRLRDSKDDKEIEGIGYVINNVDDLDKTIKVSADSIVDKFTKPDITFDNLQAVPEVEKQAMPVVVKKEKQAAAVANEIVDTTAPIVSDPTKLTDEELKSEIAKIKANIVPEKVTSFRPGTTQKAAQEVTPDSTENEKTVVVWQSKLKKLTEQDSKLSDQSKKSVSKSYSATKSSKTKRDAKPSLSVDTELTLKIMECHFNISRLTENKREYNSSYNYLVDQSWVENKKIRIKAEEYLKLLDDMDK